MKYLITLVAILLILVGGYYLFSKQVLQLPNTNQVDQAIYSDKIFVFASKDNQFTIQYDTTNDFAKLSLSGVQYDLKRDISASGTKYMSTDGKVVFWEHQGEATVEINGVIAFANATLVTDQRETALTPQSATYTIDEKAFTLSNGSVEIDTTPDSVTKHVVSVFGEPTFGDIDGDGDNDAAVILVSEPGGSGTFYYAAIAVNQDGGYIGTDSILLGDRIAPQTVTIEDKKAVFNYVDRKPGEAFAEQPSVGKSLYLQFDPETYRLIEVMNDFEGEADANTMKLTMKNWTWIKTTYNDGAEILPNKSEAFVLTFNQNGTFKATTDCNSLGGNYRTQADNLVFEKINSTLMFCENSQETEFSAILNSTKTFTFTGKGELILNSKDENSHATFR